jgi:DnaJ-class molecular chaperone
MAACGNCSGSGQVKIGTKTCSNCLGHGEYLVKEDGKLIAVKCPICKGTGDQPIYATCTVCKGRGTV